MVIIMAGLKNIVAVALVMIVSVSLEGKWVEAQVHHVVGGDRGWDPATNLSSWCSGRIFRVGDKIWFTYSAGLESIVEVKQQDEYLSCDISNPIRMYTDGLDSISLDGEGIRYFVSSKPDSCKNGLKLHVEVLPQGTPDDFQKIAASESKASNGYVSALASGPTTPSGSAHLIGSSILLAFGFLCYAIGA